jgi:nucleotidyltransferase/DNA polymerase involved in DNA repair
VEFVQRIHQRLQEARSHPTIQGHGLLERHFDRYGLRLHELACGIDDSKVAPDEPTQCVSVENTFEHDVLLAETEIMVRRFAEKLGPLRAKNHG